LISKLNQSINSINVAELNLLYKGITWKSQQQVNYVSVANFGMGRNLDIWTWVVRTELRLQEKCCSSLLDVSVCNLMTLSIADILEYGWRMNKKKKKENRWDYIDRRNRSSCTIPCTISTLCTKTQTLTDLWLNSHVTV
jgi:hypothetical protein